MLARSKDFIGFEDTAEQKRNIQKDFAGTMRELFAD